MTWSIKKRTHCKKWKRRLIRLGTTQGPHRGSEVMLSNVTNVKASFYLEVGVEERKTNARWKTS